MVAFAMGTVMNVCATVDQHKPKQAVRAKGDVKEQEVSVEKGKWSLSDLCLQTYQFHSECLCACLLA